MHFDVPRIPWWDSAVTSGFQVRPAGIRLSRQASKSRRSSLDPLLNRPQDDGLNVGIRSSHVLGRDGPPEDGDYCLQKPRPTCIFLGNVTGIDTRKT